MANNIHIHCNSDDRVSFFRSCMCLSITTGELSVGVFMTAAQAKKVCDELNQAIREHEAVEAARAGNTELAA